LPSNACVPPSRRLLERYRDHFNKWRQRFVELEGHSSSKTNLGASPLAVEIMPDPGQELDDDATYQSADSEPPNDPQVPDSSDVASSRACRAIPKLVLLRRPWCRGKHDAPPVRLLFGIRANCLAQEIPVTTGGFPFTCRLSHFASAGSHTIEAAIQAEILKTYP